MYKSVSLDEGAMRGFFPSSTVCKKPGKMTKPNHFYKLIGLWFFFSFHLVILSFIIDSIPKKVVLFTHIIIRVLYSHLMIALYHELDLIK